MYIVDRVEQTTHRNVEPSNHPRHPAPRTDRQSTTAPLRTTVPTLPCPKLRHGLPTGLPPYRIKVGFGTVAVATVAAKMHKYRVLGGGRFTHGAAAVIVEDVVVFLALFVLWCVVRWSVKRLLWWERIRRKSPLVVAALLWTPVVSLTFVALAFVAIEHLYFCSTRWVH